jgi:hypothetical protein
MIHPVPRVDHNEPIFAAGVAILVALLLITTALFTK